ncbi:hypothetical protein QYM36_002803 [Artemia franciscana]|uniref:LRRCT domain-containing protein n=1 Tax=Artemia franciscana TaxID=6661 RepID=A0AA88IKB4_ARTSF|nr:hypothetical protein QYM36_002803 [Artemia franciscana]
MLKIRIVHNLFLHNNKLQRIPSEAFQNLHEIKRLRLDSNALICDCQLIWLAKMLQDKGQETQSAVTCHDPAPMQGKPVTHLLEDEGFHCNKFIGITRWDSARYPTLIQNTRFLISIFEDNAAFRQRIAEIDVFINI